MKNLESSEVWLLELIHLECRSPRKNFDEFRSIVDKLVIFSAESFVDDGSKT